jgi:hypothetical protein
MKILGVCSELQAGQVSVIKSLWLVHSACNFSGNTAFFGIYRIRTRVISKESEKRHQKHHGLGVCYG